MHSSGHVLRGATAATDSMHSTPAPGLLAGVETGALSLPTPAAPPPGAGHPGGHLFWSMIGVSCWSFPCTRLFPPQSLSSHLGEPRGALSLISFEGWLSLLHLTAPSPQSLSSHLGEANLKDLINFCLKYLAGAWQCPCRGCRF